MSASGGHPPSFTWVPVIGTRSGQSIINLPAGVYSVSVTDANGCSFTFSDTLTDPPNLIHDFNANNLFQISPNPSDGSFTLKNLPSKEKSSLQIINPLGEIVYTENLFGKSEYVVHPNLARGIYFAKVETKDFVSVQKLIVE